jgi:hypothetical protein
VSRVLLKSALCDGSGEKFELEAQLSWQKGCFKQKAQTISSTEIPYSKLLFGVTLSHVPDMAGKKITNGAWHDAFYIKQCFRPKK